MKKKELIIILGSLLIVVLSVTLAYFTTEIFGTGKEISLDSANLKITFSSGSGNISGVNIEPGWSSGISTFTVKNESNDTYKYNIVIKELVNTFVTTGFLKYKITSADGGYNMSDYANVPKSTNAKNKVLEYSVEIAKGITHTYSVEFKYENSTTEDQSDDMGKILSGTLYIEAGTDKPTIAERILDDNPTISTRTDFSTAFTTTNTGTLYKATESIAGSTAKDVYYFAGNAKNNWVKFVKQSGISCTYSNSQVSKGNYDNGPERINSISQIQNKSECETTGICVTSEYGPVVGVTSSQCSDHKGPWVNETPVYQGVVERDMYWRIIRTNHDGSIRLLYSGTNPDTTSGYIGESAFGNENIRSMYVGYMYGTSGTLASNRTNENNSTIKKYIDNWYGNNLSSYTKYLSTEAVYCNDREVGSGTYSATGSTTFYYAAHSRVVLNYTPTYNCANSKDAFSASNNEAKLTYPIGLMTADEIAYAGGVPEAKSTNSNAWYYLNSTGGSITNRIGWWLLSPDDYRANCFFVSAVSAGTLYSTGNAFKLAVRPVLSLKGDTVWSSGDGSPENPYEIVYN